MHVLQLLAIAYGLMVLLVFVFQRRLIYFPSRMPPEVAVAVARDHGFAPWKNAAGQLIGWHIPASGPPRGSVLILHGNAGCALGRDYIAQPIHEALPLDVFVLEYPGYGGRAGAPSKDSLFAAAEEAFRSLPPGAPKYLVSESIGAGPTCELARNHPAEVAGMVLFVPYHDLAHVAQRQMPFLPAYFLLRDRYRPAEYLQHYRGPVKFVLAGADEILGVGTGQKLFAGYAGTKQLQVLPNAGHNDVSGQPPAWWREVWAFWNEHRT